MCTVRCLTIGARILRSEISFPFTVKPQICSSFNFVHCKHTSSNSDHYRKGIYPTGSHGHSSQLLCHRNSIWYNGEKYFSTQVPPPGSTGEETPKLSVFQRYKQMVKDYWYVMIPAHCITSVIWFGGFYYASTCGLDIVPILEYLNLKETWIKPFRNSSLGHLAVASALYKIATPARYTMTLGASTLAIRVLTKRGLIKPMPSKDKMKQMVKDKRDHFIQRKMSQQ